MRRQTRQRAAILDAFHEAKRPLGPREVLDLAKRHQAGLGLPTVYRAIKDLLADEAIVAVDVPGSPPRYERAGQVHHHHFICDACNRVFEMEGCPGHLLDLAPAGFTVKRHEVLLYGLCRTCGAPPHHENCHGVHPVIEFPPPC